MDGFFSGEGNIFKRMGMTPWPEAKELVIGTKRFIQHPTTGRCGRCRVAYTPWVEVTRDTMGPGLCEGCQVAYACELLTKQYDELKLRGQQVQKFAEDIINLKQLHGDDVKTHDSLLSRVRVLENDLRTAQAKQVHVEYLQKVMVELARVLSDGTLVTADQDIVPIIRGLIESKKKLDAITSLLAPPKPEPKKPEPWGGVLPKPKTPYTWPPVPGVNVTGPAATTGPINWGGEDLSVPKKR